MLCSHALKIKQDEQLLSMCSLTLFDSALAGIPRCILPQVTVIMSVGLYVAWQQHVRAVVLGIAGPACQGSQSFQLELLHHVFLCHALDCLFM